MHFTSILLGLTILDLLLVVHELGHFLAARWLGLAVPEFSIGFGPRLGGFTLGRTEFVLRLVPLAGYCLVPDLARDEDLPQVPACRRTLVMLAGPLFNFAVAALLIGPVGFVAMVQLWCESLAGLFAGNPAVQLMGPVSMTATVGEQVVSYGWAGVVFWASYLSLNFGIFNLVPFPGLDGGRLLGLALEKLNGGRRLRWEPTAQIIGLLAMVGIWLWFTGAELLRFLG